MLSALMGHGAVDINTRELIVLTLMACFGLVLALTHDDSLFAGVFAAEAALVVIAGRGK
jgi:hypothetical protein